MEKKKTPMEENEESINIKNSSQRVIRKSYLTTKNKLFLSLFLIISLVIMYKMNMICNYLISNLNANPKSTKKDIKMKIQENNLNLKEIKQKDINPSKTNKNHNINKNKPQKNKIITEEQIKLTQSQLENQLNMPIFQDINNKRTFERRYPLPKDIKCHEHIQDAGLLDMMVFTSFLTKNTTFFEFASGCSSIIAKYYTKKSYAVEGNKKWYDIGIKNGLKDNLLFRDLKCDGTGGLLSFPGKNSTLEDWKPFFQAYKKEYDADVFLIDGRFRVACAFDIFNKIRNDAIVMLHECKRSQYSIIKNYYDLIYNGGSLCVFKKKTNITKIPLDIQKKYWYEKT